MRIILVLGAIALPLAACETIEDPGTPPSLQLQTEPAPEESILDEITPPNDLLAGGEVGRPVALPSETVGDYRFHDHRAAVATRGFLNDIHAAIAACDRAAYDLARDRWLNHRYERGAQETSIPGLHDGIADSAAERAQDAAELEQMYRERPRFPVPCPPQTAMADPAWESGHWVLASAGWGWADLPATGIGFQRPDGEPERFALETADDFDTGRIGFEWAGLYPGVVLGVEYGEGDASSAGEVPAGTNIDTGVVYGALSPSGSSGINIGDRGSQNATDSEFDYWHLKAKVFLPGGRPGFRPFAYADYLRSETRHDLSYFYEGGGGFVFLVQQDRIQTLEEQAFGAGLGVLFSQQFSERWAWHALGSIGGLFRDTELRSWEHNQSNFGPMSDRDFVIERHRSDDGFGMTGTLAVGLEYRLTPRVSLGAGAHVTTLDEVGAIFNPSSGDQVFFDGLETGLTRGRASTWGAQAAIRIKLN